MRDYVEEMLVELAGEIPAEIECVKKGWEEKSILLFQTTQEMSSYMKAREDKEKSIDVYQLDNGFWAIDLSLLGRRR